MSADGFPADVDGDVLRRLKDHGFDFNRQHRIDFNVDFDAWPPAQEAIAWLQRQYPGVAIGELEGEELGDVVVQVYGVVTHDLVVQTQATISSAMRVFGGRCEAWGVLDDDPTAP